MVFLKMGPLTTLHIETLPVKAKPRIDLGELFSERPDLLNEAYIYIHCHVPVSVQEMLVRIWKSTYLIDQHSANRAALLHAENITYAPVWTLVPPGHAYTFLLIFEGLSKSCRIFNLVEDIPQPGGFFIPDICRNRQDVYHVNVV